MLPRLVRTANFKLALIYALVFCASVTVLSALVFYDMRNSLESQMRGHIEAERDQLMGDYADDGIDELRHDMRERVESQRATRLRYAIINTEGKTIFDKLDAWPPHDGWHTLNAYDGTPLLAHIATLDDGYRMAVASETIVLDQVERAMLHALTLTLLLTITFGVIGGLIVSRRFLKRVDAIATTTDHIGRGHLSERIALNGTGDDFDQLAGAVNQMLARIEQLMGEIQHVSTSIAHDLRTPLTKLRIKLESLDASSAREESLQLLDEALATFSALLLIAEIESKARQQGFARIDLSDLLGQLAEAYGPSVEEQGGVLNTNITPDITVMGDANLLRQLIANGIENALKHNKPGTNITLALYALEGRATLEMADDGQGIPPEQFEAVLKPFHRLDASRHRKGNGLGLSLIAAIARLHEAKLALASNHPGLRVLVTFI